MIGDVSVTAARGSSRRTATAREVASGVDPVQGAETASKLRAESGVSVHLGTADLSDPASRFATNHLGHFLLAQLLPDHFDGGASRNLTANASLPGAVLTGLRRFHGDELLQRIGLVGTDGAPHPSVRTVKQGAATSVWPDRSGARWSWRLGPGGLRSRRAVGRRRRSLVRLRPGRRQR